MNKNTIVFVVGAIVMMIGWNWIMGTYYPPLPPAAIEAAAKAKAGETSATGAVAATASNSGKTTVGATKASLSAPKAEFIALSTTAYEISLSSQGARLDHLKLHGVASQLTGTAQELDLIGSLDHPRYGTLQLPGVDLESQNWALLTKKPVLENGKQTVRFATQVKDTPITITKTYQFDPEKPQFDLRVSLKNAGNQPLSLSALSLQWGPNLGGNSTGIGQFPPSGTVQMEGSIEREEANDEQNVHSYNAPRWVALKNHYFVTGYFPQSKEWNKAELRRLGAGKIEAALVADGLVLQPGKTVDLDVLVYAGAQDYAALQAFGKNFEAVIQFQYYNWLKVLNPLCVLLLKIMKWFHQVTGNWGVAIVLLTLLVRGVMFYPSLKSMVSMRKMQVKMAAMQPRLDTIKKMYKDDAQKLNAEMMKLYKEYGVNPLGGCLPMLLQIPIFFALYGTLSAAYELRGADFMWKWTDLTAGDPTYIFPLAMGISMFAQQKLAPISSGTMSEEQAQMQKMMLWMMPIMFTGMSIYLHWPMGLLLYWTASNIFGVVQQLVVNKSVK